jgi:hypothetical protein
LILCPANPAATIDTSNLLCQIYIYIPIPLGSEEIQSGIVAFKRDLRGEEREEYVVDDGEEDYAAGFEESVGFKGDY